MNFSDISKQLPTGNLTIQLCSRDFQLGTVTIANRSSLQLKGLPTRLTCNTSSNTGIHIYNVVDLVLQDIELMSCGALFNALKEPERFNSSIYIVNCIDVTISRLKANGSRGNGLTLLDNYGITKILNCTFTQSKGDQYHSETPLKPSGSGLSIVLSYCGTRHRGNYKCPNNIRNNVNGSSYYIERCNFTKNSAADIPNKLETDTIDEGFGKGGGLSIVIDKNATDNLIQITDCNFYENSAKWGGALYLKIQANSLNNTVYIRNCTFCNNTCKIAGGGIDVG